MFFEIHVMQSFNQIIGKICEIEAEGAIMRDNCFPQKLEKGADYLAICFHKPSYFVDAKTNRSRRTPNEDRVKKLSEYTGLVYKEHRCRFPRY